MSQRCVNPSCATEVKDGWAFCSYCGTDNRPPSHRFKVVGCDHQIENGEFCVLCGASAIDANEPDNPESKWAEWLGWGLLLTGVALLTFSQIGRSGANELGRDAPEYAQRMGNAYGAGRIGFIMIPAGIFFVVVMGRRWRWPWGR